MLVLVPSTRANSFMMCAMGRLPPAESSAAIDELRRLPTFFSLLGKTKTESSYSFSTLRVCMCAVQEDLDSTPCAAVPLPDQACEKATAVLVDELSSTMWTGNIWALSVLDSCLCVYDFEHERGRDRESV